MVKANIDWVKEIRVDNELLISADQSLKLGELQRFVGNVVLDENNITEDEKKSLKTLFRYLMIIKSKTNEDKFFLYQNGSGLPINVGGHVDLVDVFIEADKHLKEQIEFLLKDGKERTGKERT